jgi:hypothetical protein
MTIRQLLTSEGFEDYRWRLLESGVGVVDWGFYSQVFQHPTLDNIVVKVFTNNDQPYWRYVKWCVKHQHNPFVPQILDVVKVKCPRQSYGIVFLEKLKPIRKAPQLVKLLASTINFTNRELKLLDRYFAEHSMIRIFSLIERVVKRGKASDDFTQVWQQIERQGSSKFDLHHGNAMLRGHQLVITDPVSNSRPVDHIGSNF